MLDYMLDHIILGLMSTVLQVFRNFNFLKSKKNSPKQSADKK